MKSKMREYRPFPMIRDQLIYLMEGMVETVKSKSINDSYFEKKNRIKLIEITEKIHLAH